MTKIILPVWKSANELIALRKVFDSDSFVNKIQNGIKPDVVAMTSFSLEQVEGKYVISVKVSRGVKRPYYLSEKGLRPEGVFVRSGSSSIPSTDTAILQMIKESDGDTFETQRSLRQDLSFDFAETQFMQKDMSFGDPEKRTLGLIDSEGIYTNLALLLSDDCPTTIKAAAFKGDERSVFTERTEFSGSLLKQLQDAYAFLEKHNFYETSYEGLERKDYYDYPPIALRECLVNSVVHREYALSGPTLLSVFESNIEIVSLGGLPTGITLEDINAHISLPRNRLLANIFFRLEIIEAYGTGIRRSKESYSGSGVELGIQVTPNTFSVDLPNRNAVLQKKSPKRASVQELDADEKSVLEAIQEGMSKRVDIEKRTSISQATLLRILKSLIEKGFIRKEGRGKNTLYLAREK